MKQLKVDVIDLSQLALDGFISREAMWYIFKQKTNWLGEFEGAFPENVDNGDSFSCDGKVYQMFEGKIVHTGCLLFLNQGETIMPNEIASNTATVHPSVYNFYTTAKKLSNKITSTVTWYGGRIVRHNFIYAPSKDGCDWGSANVYHLGRKWVIFSCDKTIKAKKKRDAIRKWAKTKGIDYVF